MKNEKLKVNIKKTSFEWKLNEENIGNEYRSITLIIQILENSSPKWFFFSLHKQWNIVEWMESSLYPFHGYFAWRCCHVPSIQWSFGLIIAANFPSQLWSMKWRWTSPYGLFSFHTIEAGCRSWIGLQN